MLFLSGCLTILFAICTQSNGLFTPNSDLLYEYTAIIRTGTLTPAHGSSDWELKGNLRLQVHENKVILKFNNLTISIFNGKPGIIPDAQKIFQPIPDEAKDLYEPFTIHYRNGKVKNLSVKDGESTWSLNIKRGLGSIFQLEEEKFNLPAFISQEDTLYGQCTVEYTLIKEENRLRVRKFIDHSTCQGYPRLIWKNTSPLLCPSGHKIVTSSTGREYFLIPKDNYYNLEHLETNSGLDVQPFHAQGELSYAFVKQSLLLISDDTIHENIQIPENSRTVNFLYELPNEDITHGRSPSSDEEYLKLVDNYVKRIIESLEKNPFQSESEFIHNDNIPHLLYFLSLLKRPYLEEYYNNLSIGTSYYQETQRNLFLKLLPQVGSDDAILLIQDLVLSGREKEKNAVELLTILPFYIRHPSEDLLKTSEKLLNLGDKIVDEVKQSAILTFSIMVHKICKVNCRPETLEKYIRLFVDKLANSQSYSEQMLYLEVLNNIELGNVFDYMLPIIQGNVSVLTTQPHHIRFLGVWASMSQAIFHPGKVHQVYWPILTNRSEHLEMRVAALTMLILAKPTHSNFINLLWFMQTEKNAHLLHFYYTTLESLIETKYPCYTMLGTLASHVIRYIRPPSTRNWATGNYILDYSDPKYGFGGLAQLFAVANQRTGNPNVFYLLVNSHAMDHNLRQFAIYIKLEGVTDALNKMIFRDHKKVLNFVELINILQEIKAPTAKTEDIHIEIIAKIEDRVVYCQYINRTNFHKLIEVASKLDLMAQEVSINYQTVKAPLLMEITQPLDIGVPILLRTESTVLTSLRGNFTKEWNGSSHFRRNELDIRYSFNSGSSIIIYNPVLNVWHATRRSISYHSYFASNISFQLNDPDIRVSFADPSGVPRGFLAHARTSVHIYGKNSSMLNYIYCPSCPAVFVVNANNERNKQEVINVPGNEFGTDVKVSLYDCEQSYSTKHLYGIVKNIFIESNKNYRVLPISQLLLGVIHSLDLLTLVPPKGSCGIRFELSPSTKEQTEITLSHSSIDLNSNKILNFTMDLTSQITRKSLKSWMFTARYGVEDEDTKHKLDINITSSTGGQEQQKVCFTGETLFPKSRNGLLPWNPSDDVTAKAKVSWGNNNESCPSNGGDVEVTAFGQVTEEQKKLSQNSSTWPHSACLEDTKNVEEWGVGYTPITEACYRASVEVATLRKYTATFKFNKVPKSFNHLRKKISAFTDIFHTGLITHSSDDFSNLTVSFEIPKNKQVILRVNNKQLTLPKIANWLKPFLVNTYIHAIVPHVMTFGVIGSCVVNSANVISFDNVTKSFSASPCYTLVTGDCTEQPRFAIFVKRISEAKPLAAKIYLDGSIIDIVPTNNGALKIFLNNKSVETDKKGHQVTSETKNIFHIRQLEEGLVRIISQLSHIWLQHNGHFLTLVIPNIYRGELCGLCGDFNGDSSNDWQETLSIPCSDVNV